MSNRDRKTRQARVLELYINQKLKKLMRNCRFKQAWVPKGWACVEISIFAYEAAKEMAEILPQIDRIKKGDKS